MSEIKGGGRATLSEASERALVDCLMKRHQCWPVDGDGKNVKEHALQRERKRFVKRLVGSYEGRQAHAQINNVSLSSMEGGTHISSKKKPSGKSSSTSQSTDLVSGNVRFELMEATFAKKTGKMKAGAKKLMVLPRATTLVELLSQAQNKLRMKKPPTRIFLIVSGKTEQHVDLQNNLAGIKDGTALYATTTPSKMEDEEDKQKIANGSADQQDEEDLDDTLDPLETVKQAYNDDAFKFRRAPMLPSGLTLPMEHPKFSSHFSSLPALSQSSAELPAANARKEVLEAVQENQVVIICGTTGCGKSTQVPQFLWQGLRSAGCKYANILVTQPRRVAATALALRVSQEMGSLPPGKPGSLVGHHVRLDRAVADSTQIVYCTVGILLRQLVSPANHNDDCIPLSEYTHLCIDEVHERDVNTDFLLTLLRATLTRNPHLRVILMSATASADLFVDYFTRFQPVVLTIPGRTFPVETKWLDDCQRLAGKSVHRHHEDVIEEELAGIPLSPRATIAIDFQFLEALIANIVREQKERGDLVGNGKFRRDGAILVFLPGKGEIEALFRALVKGETLSKLKNIDIHKLHSGVTRKAQQTVFDPAPTGRVKIILTTNIAETSVTIADASIVIDTGRVKESRYNSETRLKELVTVWTSQASAKQRAGRAGRTCPGVCYRLYSQSFYESKLPLQTSPEMVRTPLDELILQVCLLYEQRRKSGTKGDDGVNPAQLLNQVPEPPSAASLEQACQHLLEVDALVPTSGDQKFRLTPLGFHLSRLPMDAKVGKVLIVGCLLGCAQNALTVAASLSCSKSCFYHRFGGSIVDRQFEEAVDRRAKIIENGFGGKDWKGGTVKGDFMAVIACFRAWKECPTDQDRFQFARDHAIDHVAMKEINDLRQSFSDLLKDAGFYGPRRNPPDHHGEDALLTSACWVAGLYPNICTLLRPRKGGPKGGRLLTKEGDSCRPQVQSFQRSRVQRAAEAGKDAYAVYHTKHRSVSTGSQPRKPEIFLSNVNFVSRYALLLFSGDLQIQKNAVIVDGWLKFKIGDIGKAGAVLLWALRRELDAMLLTQISGAGYVESQSNELLAVVRRLLAEE